MKIFKILVLVLFTITFFVPVNSYARMSCGSNAECCNGLGSCEGGQCKGCGSSILDMKASTARVASRQICNAKGCADPGNPPPQSNKAQYSSWCCILGMSCCGGEERPPARD